MPTSFELSQLILISAAYLLLLFGVAWTSEKGLIPRWVIRHPLTYTLSLGVYASAWAFYGTVGLAYQYGFGFLASSVARTLYLDGVYLLPPLLYLIGRWHKRDADRRGGPARSVLGWALLHLGEVFGPALGGAAVTALSVYFVGRQLGAADDVAMHGLSYVVGVPLALAGQWWLLYAPGRPLHRAATRLFGLGD